MRMNLEGFMRTKAKEIMRNRNAGENRHVAITIKALTSLFPGWLGLMGRKATEFFLDRYVVFGLLPVGVGPGNGFMFYEPEVREWGRSLMSACVRGQFSPDGEAFVRDMFGRQEEAA